jgi:hypothetical protein
MEELSAPRVQDEFTELNAQPPLPAGNQEVLEDFTMLAP